MKKTATPQGVKDENGAYKPLPTPKIYQSDKSLDDLLNQGRLAIERTMHHIVTETASGMPERETIMNLKDIMAMLHELKEREAELLDSLSDEELEKALK